MTDSTQFYHSNLFPIIEDSISKARQEVLLVAPFIKNKLLHKLLNNLNNGVKLTVITRWRIEEILSGVSDIEIWELFKERKESSLKLLNNLHAKYYRFDQTCILGSANLTQMALLEFSGSNLEILCKNNFQEKTKLFEDLILKRSINVSPDLYLYINNLLNKFSHKELPTGRLNIDFQLESGLKNQKNLNFEYWIPKSRNPENLYEFYTGNSDALTKDQIRHAEFDLSDFPISFGLNKDEFKEWIAFYLIQMPLIQEIDKYLDKPRRFGEISDFLDERLKLKECSVDPKRIWQTLMRWLLFFLNDKYEYKQPKYTEVFVKK